MRDRSIYKPSSRLRGAILEFISRATNRPPACSSTTMPRDRLLVVLSIIQDIVFFSFFLSHNTARLAVAKPMTMFVFGDSIVDGGSNKFIGNASSPAMFSPYGETYFRAATGRFSDGRTLADALADWMSIPYVRPYLDPGAVLDTGANFAVAGSRLMGENMGTVSFQAQIHQFATRAGLLRERFGDDHARTILRESLFFIAIGSIDVEQAYFPANSSARAVPTAWPLYVSTMMEEYGAMIRALYSQGARKIVVMALAPLGCMPAARLYVVRRLAFIQRGGCLHTLNEMAIVFNHNLRNLVNKLLVELPELAIVLVKPYSLILNAIRSPLENGFTDSRDACCGDGIFRAVTSCSNTTFLCPVPSTHLFWDSAHLTEAANLFLMRCFWYGDLRVAEPYNLKRLLS